jgi:hypothetical protein
MSHPVPRGSGLVLLVLVVSVVALGLVHLLVEPPNVAAYCSHCKRILAQMPHPG